MNNKIYERLMILGSNSGCHQLPNRSFYINGKKFPVCARCTGVFIGNLVAYSIYLIYLPQLRFCMLGGRVSYMVNIKLLKALNGDSIILSYGAEKIYHMLIDGGQGRLCFRQLCNFVDSIKKEKNKINVVVLTHIDSDHIDGILHLYSKDEFDFSVIEQMWFNFGELLWSALGVEGKGKNVTLYRHNSQISWKQGESLESILQNTEIRRECFVKALDTFIVGDAKITILSPNVKTLRELVLTGGDEKRQVTQIASVYDYDKSILELNELKFEGKVSLTNKSSIAFLFEYKEIKLLFLGDADSETLISSLMELGYSKQNKLKVDFCKIAHHASKHNTSNELIQLLDCSNYILSTQQTAQGRPSKECLSRIICNSTSPVKFYCNYNCKHLG